VPGKGRRLFSGKSSGHRSLRDLRIKMMFLQPYDLIARLIKLAQASPKVQVSKVCRIA
jgi:hypothetical protein